MVGCQKPQQIRPTKPVIKAIPQQDGGVCFSRQDAIELGTYILELER